MKFYISPSDRITCEKKINRILANLTTKPTVTFSPVRKMVKTTIFNWGYEGYERCREEINAIEVEIEDILVGEWRLVASVYFKQDMITMVDSKLFKSIPEQYGLDYEVCDACGGKHPNRNESHIIYSEVQDKWMQVGSGCINKLVNGGKYLNNLMLKLYNTINMFGGCDEEEWHGGWAPKNNTPMMAMYFRDAISAVKHYMDTVSNNWVKAVWDNGYKIEKGTNSEIQEWLMEGQNFPTANELTEAVKKYYDKIPYGEEGYEKTLTQKIKDAFENEYIRFSEMYIPWFAITAYMNSLKAEDFSEIVASKGYEKGGKYEFPNARLIESYTVESEDWRGYPTMITECRFEYDGLQFMKDVSYLGAIDPYKNEDGTYSFRADVKWIDRRNCRIRLGGRFSKIPAPKKSKKSNN